MSDKKTPVAAIHRDALNLALIEQGGAFCSALSERHDHLFADVALCISNDQLAQMRAVIDAVESVVQSQFLPPVRGKVRMGVETAIVRQVSTPTLTLGETTSHSTKLKETSAKSLVIPLQGGGNDKEARSALGVFYGYDFHLNADGAHLIEINTNAGGAFLNALLIDSLRETGLPGKALEDASTGSARTEINLWQSFIAMFRNEWRLARGDVPLNSIAIVDESPIEQYLYPEFLLAKNCLERDGAEVFIVTPDDLQARDDGLYVDNVKIDLIYNRLTDFSLQSFPHLLAAYENNLTVFTPNPAHYQCYADKRKLVELSDVQFLQSVGIAQPHIDALLYGVPQTKLVSAANADVWWAERKQWFFKPVNGYGSKGAYRGDKITKRVFEEIMQSDYVAQRLAMPGECEVKAENGDLQTLKYDVRCYVYDGHIQLIAARLYQGQTTNFRTSGGGFALVRVVE